MFLSVRMYWMWEFHHLLYILTSKDSESQETRMKNNIEWLILRPPGDINIKQRWFCRQITASSQEHLCKRCQFITKAELKLHHAKKSTRSWNATTFSRSQLIKCSLRPSGKLSCGLMSKNVKVFGIHKHHVLKRGRTNLTQFNREHWWWFVSATG